jgi:hypothetical protein
MANTTNFNWATPDDTDLVKDGALAIRTLGSAIDASLGDLQGGTTGQVLAKNSNDDMDFVWTSDQVGIPASTVDAKGDLIAGTADNTVSRLAAGTNEHRLVADSAQATGLKYVADTTNYAIAAKGNLLVGTAADTVAALSVGTNGHVLTADSAESTGVKWAPISGGGGKVLQVVSATTTTATTIASTSFTDTTLTASITPSSATSKVLVLVQQASYSDRQTNQTGLGLQLVRTSTNILTTDGELFYMQAAGATSTILAGYQTLNYLDSPNTTSATTYKTQMRAASTSNSGKAIAQVNSNPSSIVLLEIGA